MVAVADRLLGYGHMSSSYTWLWGWKESQQKRLGIKQWPCRNCLVVQKGAKCAKHEFWSPFLQAIVLLKPFWPAPLPHHPSMNLTSFAFWTALSLPAGFRNTICYHSILNHQPQTTFTKESIQWNEFPQSNAVLLWRAVFGQQNKVNIHHFLLRKSC